MTRRWLARLGAASLALLGAALAVPAAIVATFPTRRRTVGGDEAPIRAARLDDLPEGTPVKVALRAPVRRDAWQVDRDVLVGAAWLCRRGGAVQAFSTVCPHAGCAVDWDAGAGAFVCPCHDSRFAPGGEPLAGPSPRALDPLPAEARDGAVFVTWRRFRPGVARREPI